MNLDIIVPTYNRHELLERTLNSLLSAPRPVGLEHRVTVVDNNSSDGTVEVVQRWQRRFGGRLQYLFEGRQGRSAALNCGIQATSGELIGMIDDDEEIDANWYRVVFETFSAGEVDFLGGPYVPRWGAPPPKWLPKNYLGVIGWVDGGDRSVPFGENYPGILMGGNAVIARSTLETVGLYVTSVSRTGSRLFAGEDEDLYRRLLAAGARGLYLPEMVIYHYVPPERLRKSYFRRWCFWRGVSRGVLDRLVDQTRLSPEHQLLGVPRWLYGEAARALARMGGRLVTTVSEPSKSFSDELAAWDLAGRFYGRHFYRPAPTKH